jgi:sugar phosphate isomerase/epimerase
MMTRRQLMALGMAGAGHLAMTPLTGAAAREQTTRGTWGVQLYTVRNQISKDPASTLKAVADIGYKELEVLQPTLPTVAPIAKKLGLSIVSAHLDLATAGGQGVEAFIAQAREHGLRYIVIPYVAPADRPTTRAGFEQLAARCRAIGEVVTRAGMTLCYHNHAFEFGRDADGARWLDVLMQATAASGMQLELDVFWASIAGGDPLELLNRYSGRVALMHLKDKARGSRTTLVESDVPREAFVEVGAGALDFPAILAASRAAGVAHYFVEQDATPGDPVESLKKSYAYLTAAR